MFKPYTMIIIHVTIIIHMMIIIMETRVYDSWKSVQATLSPVELSKEARAGPAGTQGRKLGPGPATLFTHYHRGH